MSQQLEPHQVSTAGTSEGNTLAVDATDTLAYVVGSVPIILIPNGGDASDVDASTPVGSIIVPKG